MATLIETNSLTKGARQTIYEDGEIAHLGVALADEGSVVISFDEHDVGDPIEERTMRFSIARTGMDGASLSIPLVDALWLATTLQREINLEINQR